MYYASGVVLGMYTLCLPAVVYKGASHKHLGSAFHYYRQWVYDTQREDFQWSNPLNVEN